jgi:hypothetical protein
MTDELFDQMYGNKYLGAADLKGKSYRLPIGKTEVAELREKDGTTKKKYVVFFNGTEKGLVLNKTNALALAGAYGKDPTAWSGQEVEVYSEMTGIGKEGVRVRPVRVPVPIKTDLNDSVPF